MRINIIIELTEEFRTAMRECGLRAGLLLALGVLSAMLVGLTLSFPMAALAVVCLLLAAWFGYGLRIVHKPSAFAREREALWIARLDAMLRQNEELREKIKRKRPPTPAQARKARAASEPANG